MRKCRQFNAKIDQRHRRGQSGDEKSKRRLSKEEVVRECQWEEQCVVSGRNDDDTLPHRRGHLAATWISLKIATLVVDKNGFSFFFRSLALTLCSRRSPPLLITQFSTRMPLIKRLGTQSCAFCNTKYRLRPSNLLCQTSETFAIKSVRIQYCDLLSPS